ncbi:MAG: diacylglycerol kinase [Polaromonas sp.]|nr:diacylglycerol kinase [Polaromonas sp.]
MPQSQADAEIAARNGPLFVVLNAGSGNNDAQEARRVMGEVFEQAGRRAEFLTADTGASIAQLASRAVALALAQGGVVVAAGGDGTINAVAGAVLGSGCPFGVLPQGTFNYFGRVNAIPQDTRAAAQALVGARVLPVQVGQVNGKVFLVNASLGLYPQLLEDRETWKQQLGRSRAVAFLSGLATLARHSRQLKLEVELGGKTMALRTPTLFVGNNRLQLERVGIEASDADATEQGELVAIVLKPIGSLALFGLLLRGVLGRLGEANTVDSFSFRRMTVRLRGVRRIKVATDGEIVWMTSPLVFEVAPLALRLMVPAPEDCAPVE